MKKNQIIPLFLCVIGINTVFELLKSDGFFYGGVFDAQTVVLLSIFMFLGILFTFRWRVVRDVLIHTFYSKKKREGSDTNNKLSMPLWQILVAGLFAAFLLEYLRRGNELFYGNFEIEPFSVTFLATSSGLFIAKYWSKLAFVFDDKSSA
jgi:hypothetical protein